MHTSPNTSPAESVDSLLARSPVDSNAWKHGMYARKVLIPVEDQCGFDALRDALVAEWRPRSVTAWMLVDYLAKLQWRLMRAGEAETQRLFKLTTMRGVTCTLTATATPEAALAWDASRADSSMHRLQIFQMRLERSVHRVIGQLLVLRKMRGKLRGKRGDSGRNPPREKSTERPAGPTIGPSTHE